MKNACIIFLSVLTLNSFGQRWKTMKGNGETKKESRTVGNFSSLLSQGAADVQLEYGNSGDITVEADENLLPYLETIVENGKLIIRSKKNVNLQSRSKMVVHASMTKINSLQLSGSGNVNGEGAFTGEGKTDIGISGSGKINLRFDSFKELQLSVSGSGNMDLQGGKTDNITAEISGSGNIDCSSVSSEDVDAAISGSGNVKVNVSRSINAKISGSGNVMYKGTAENITSKTSGSGKVLKI